MRTRGTWAASIGIVVALIGALGVVLALAGCVPPGPEVYFEIQGPENTVVEITRSLNGKDSSKEEKLERERLSDEHAIYGEKMRVSKTWEKGATITATVTLTSDGSEKPERLKLVKLDCLVYDSDGNLLDSKSNTHTVSCGVNFYEK